MVEAIYWYEYYIKNRSKIDSEKYFFKLMNNSVFGKTMGNVRKYRDIVRLITADKRRIYLVSEPNYNAEKCFSENLLGIEMIKIKVKINQSTYLNLYQYLKSVKQKCMS